MIGKRARPPKKPNVLFLLVLMFHLNNICLWSLPYQFTCQLQWEHLIIVFIISTNTNKEPSITSPPAELHILFPNQKWFPWVRITEDNTFIFCKQLRLSNTVIFFCASSSQSSTHARKTCSIGGSFNTPMSTPKVLSWKSKLISSSPIIALCPVASNFSMRSQRIHACDIFKETNKTVLFSVNLPLRWDFFPSLTCFTLPQLLSAGLIPQSFDVTQHATNPSTTCMEWNASHAIGKNSLLWHCKLPSGLAHDKDGCSFETP